MDNQTTDTNARIEALELDVAKLRQALTAVVSVLENLTAADSTSGIPTSQHGQFLALDISRIRELLH